MKPHLPPTSTSNFQEPVANLSISGEPFQAGMNLAGDGAVWIIFCRRSLAAEETRLIKISDYPATHSLIIC